MLQGLSRVGAGVLFVCVCVECAEDPSPVTLGEICVDQWLKVTSTWEIFRNSQSQALAHFF